jgi:outer membrane protein assembly factor BamB
VALAALLAQAAAGADASAPEDWPQWGGPWRDFQVEGRLAATWPAGGPRVVWRRLLGDGYSGVAAVGGRLYTLLRAGADEVAIAIDAATGETLWSHRYPAPVPDYLVDDRGVGPRSTPSVTADRVFAVGVRGTLHALDRATGEPVWRRELVADLGGSEDRQGYAASPLLYRDLVIVPVGGRGRALVALRQRDGSIAWRGGDWECAPASPFLIELGGVEQVVALLDGAVAGFSASTGRELWRHPHPSPRGDRNISTPAWDGRDRLFVSSLDGGTRLVRLEPRVDTPSESGAPAGSSAIAATEVWSSNRVRLQFTNALWRGDAVYASNGGSGPIPLTAIAAATGDVLWRDRSFGRAQLVQVGEDTLLLDEDGTLAVVRLAPDRLRVLASAQVLVGEQAWTAPTVVGRRVYLRTRARLVALELPEP